MHSRTVYERVAALVSIAANPTTADTGTPITFSGQVDPNHAGQRVLPAGADRSDRRLAHAQERRAERELELLDLVPLALRRACATSGRCSPATGEHSRCSDGVTVTIQQHQVPGLHDQHSQPIIPEGSSVKISGVLTARTTTPEPPASRCGAGVADQAQFRRCQSRSPAATEATLRPEADGQHALPGAHHVRAATATRAVLFEGVRDVRVADAELDHVHRRRQS